jgi:PRC-barrel domain protein
MANCVPAQPPKWQLRHKRKATASKSKEAPPQTAGTVTETPPGTPVDAQVGELGSEVTSILGKKVQGPKGEDLGRIVDVLADGSGRVRAAIIDFGGFLGVGTRRIAVDWPLLRFDPNARGKNLILTVSRQKLQSAPEYKDAKSPQVLMPPAPAPDAAAEAADAKK